MKPLLLIMKLILTLLDIKFVIQYLNFFVRFKGFESGTNTVGYW